MIGNLIVAGILALVILCAVLFARFLEWRDCHDMTDANSHIHWVKHGVFDTRTTKVEW